MDHEVHHPSTLWEVPSPEDGELDPVSHSEQEGSFDRLQVIARRCERNVRPAAEDEAARSVQTEASKQKPLRDQADRTRGTRVEGDLPFLESSRKKGQLGHTRLESRCFGIAELSQSSHRCAVLRPQAGFASGGANLEEIAADTGQGRKGARCPDDLATSFAVGGIDPDAPFLDTEPPERDLHSGLFRVALPGRRKKKIAGRSFFSSTLWWRCRDLNPGHCGYEPHALTN